MRAKEAGPLSNKSEPPANSLCAHGRMVEDERNPDGQKSGRLVCMECGMVLPNPSAIPSTD